MNVRELRDILDEGDGFEGAELRSAEVESRCDEVDRLYLWGAQDEDEDTPA